MSAQKTQARLIGFVDLRGLLGVALLLVGSTATADALESLREFVRDGKSGRGNFTQTVTSADGARKKVSSGSFEFQRPNRFRFQYSKPFEQLIVADGVKVWIFDADLNQASSRKIAQALGSTPASILAGGAIEKDFDLAAQPSRDGLDWALATPKVKDGAIQSMRIGFRGKELAAIDIADGFGQRSLLQFSAFAANVNFAADRFSFTPPAGADVIEQ
jgi:outer membrane lipoprotein carrier protein